MFIGAGFEWRERRLFDVPRDEPRLLGPASGARRPNRNFEGRQGAGGRTHLVSPEVAAATALAGHFVCPGVWRHDSHYGIRHDRGRPFCSIARTSTPN